MLFVVVFVVCIGLVFGGPKPAAPQVPASRPERGGDAQAQRQQQKPEKETNTNRRKMTVQCNICRKLHPANTGIGLT
eukprot:13949743-Heterocapsa_arctica.AAC.1